LIFNPVIKKSLNYLVNNYSIKIKISLNKFYPEVFNDFSPIKLTG